MKEGCGFVEHGGARLMTGTDLQMFAPNLIIPQLKDRNWNFSWFCV